MENKVSLTDGFERYNLDKSGNYKLESSVVGDSYIEITLKEEGKINLDIKVEEGERTLVLLNSSVCDTEIEIKAEIDKDSVLKLGYIELSSNKTNLKSLVLLNKEGAYAEFKTATVCNTDKKYDIETVHVNPHTKGLMENYGVVYNEASLDIVCAGRINKDSYRSDSRQATRVLTFGNPKNIRVLPILYIDNNDVAASHATSIGQPDAEALYYMESRGLTKEEAIALMANGYLTPVCKMIKDETLREETEKRITERVEG